MNNLTPEQAEIIDLLRNEIADMIESDTSAFKQPSPEPQVALLQQLETELDHLGNACTLAGLTGLEVSSRHLSRNFQALQQSCPVSEAQGNLYTQWTIHFLGYLNYVGDKEKELQYVNGLLTFLCDSNWPHPLPAAEVAEIKTKFADSDLSTITNDDVKLPVKASEDMASLAIGEDVRADLLSGMLVELPEQVRVFEESIGQFMDIHSIEELTNARRMAHTLKGAANIVGIKGLANLMHFTEDLLEIAAKQRWQSIPEGFADVLQDAADCLASSAEFFTGISSQPDNVQSVQQSILDWVHAIQAGKTPELPDYTPIESDLANTPEEPVKHIAVEAHEVGDNADFDSIFADADDLQEADDSSTTRNELIDSAHISKLDAELDDILNQPAPAPTPSATTPQSKTPVETDDDDKHFINLPESTAHNLLRIAGEVQIGNTQIASQVEAMKASIQLTDRYHKQIRAMAAELEAMIQTQSAMRSATLGYDEGEIDPLEMERFNELHTFSHQLLELTTDSYEAVSHIGSQIDDLTNLAYTQNKLNDDSQSLLLEMRLVPVKMLSSRFSRCVRQVCRLTGKSARLEIEGDDILIDSRVLSRIADPIMHLLRNAVDHGLENSAQARKNAGKTPEGNIKLRFRHQGETISIECRDDGKGLDYNKIYQTAVNSGLLQNGEQVDNNYLNQVVLMPGFSTREHASQTSGRGIGLDAVMSDVRLLKGNLNISSEQGVGCQISISVPSSILSSHALVIESRGSQGKQILSLVSRSVEQILYISAGDLKHTAKGMFYDLNGTHLPVYNINDLTDIHRYHDDQMGALIVSRKVDGTLVGVAVEAILASQNLVIKPLNDLCIHPPGVIGATILGDGTVSPVIDLQELPGMVLSQDELHTLRKHRHQIASLERERQLPPPIALVVDDSLSARRSLAQFVADLGMEVYTAKDGFEAISLVEEKHPALMLVDLEMPRMNGLELTAHLRSREDTSNIPVIMITSRSTEKHRELAESAGVNTYLNKPWSEEELMSTIQKQIA